MEAQTDEQQRLCNNEEILLLNYNEQKEHGNTFEYHGKQRPIDFVLAAHTREENARIEKHRKYFFQNLKKRRLKISKPRYSKDGLVTFWLLYAPFDVLCDTAEDVSLRLPTVPNDIEVNVWYDSTLNKFWNWWDKKDPFKIQRSFFPTTKCYFSDIFDKNRLKEFHNGSKKDKLFTQIERSRLVSFILESTCFTEDESVIGKAELLSTGVFTAAYTLHDGPLLVNDIDKAVNKRQKLSKEWASFKKILKYQPLDAIKDYFGVTIAFYYAWTGFLTMYLVPASIIGVLCFFFAGLSNFWFEPLDEICSPKNASGYYMCPLCDKLCSYYYLKDFSCVYAKVTHLFDNDGTAFFAVFMSIWSVFFLEYWKRQQCTLSYNWNTMDFREEEVVRPQYSAVVKKLKKNPVNDKMEPFMNRKEHCLKISGAFSVVLFFIAMVIAALVGVIVYRAAIFGILLSHGEGSLKENSKIFVTATAAIINLLVINILKVVYNRLAKMMTEWENPRTRTSYEKSFTMKMFWFQFCNTYASVFYVAFFKSEQFTGWPGHYRRFGSGNKYRLEGCSVQGCFLELCVQLVILMGGQQLLGNFVEICWPYIKKRYNKWKHGLDNNQNIPMWEADYQLSEQEDFALFWEYQEVVIQYGFVTMFVAAFPLAPLIALITNLIEIRIDAINMIKLFRRPVAYKSDGIGVWYDIMVTLTALGVLVNGFVLSITSEFIPRLVYKYQFSPDGSLKGYVDWSLSHFKVTDFMAEERPENAKLNVNEVLQYCRYPGFHYNTPPYNFNDTHWEIMAMRLIFAFLFQWLVTAVARILSWIIPDRPRHLILKIKRQEFLAKEALRRYKIKTGRRKPDHEGDESSEGSCDESTVRSRKGTVNSTKHRSNSKTRSKKSKKKSKSETMSHGTSHDTSHDEHLPHDVPRDKPRDDGGVNGNVTYVPYSTNDYLNQML